uniref:RING-type E3 ubiquitin transferase n=1 Tax=Odontella aurita TaxID=265563 RepID=A0A7S4K8L7_9STRA|mmetsp:Transcript_6413/g.18818  ORF Transcript_6413/g.18818 Transcript_6413/m.18818 type:complete len:1558 (+) Transcript_6413:116-4789(+)
MHGARTGVGRYNEDEYEWRRVDANGRQRRAEATAGGGRRFASPSLTSDLASALGRGDAAAARVLLGRLPSTILPPPRDGRWVQTPPASRVVHEAVRGDEGAFAVAFVEGSPQKKRISSVDLLKTLRSCGCDMDLPDADGRTPLWIAVDRGDADAVRFLVRECEGDVDVDARDLGGWAPLHAAAEGQRAEIAKILARDGRADMNAMDHHGWTALHAAAEKGRLDVVRHLRELGAEVDVPNDEGRTALHTVARAAWNRALANALREDCCGALEAVDFLAGPLCNADVNATDDSGDTPLLAAARSDNFEVIRYLHDQCGAGVSVASHYGYTPLHSAAGQGILELARYVVERGADPRARTADGSTPLHEIMGCITTCESDLLEYISVARFLAGEECHSIARQNGREGCADVNARDDEGLTPMLILLRDGTRQEELMIQFFQCLVNDLGADVAGVADVQGNTALHFVAMRVRYGCVPEKVIDDILNVDGVQIDARNAKGMTPLHCGIHMDKLVLYLHGRGAAVNTVDNEGQTPLHAAVASGSLETVKIVVERCGADLDCADHNGLSPLRMAELYTRRSPELPRNKGWMSDKDIRDTWGAIDKYLRDAGASSFPMWWTPTNLVGAALSNSSLHALESFANGGRGTTVSRPHVASVVYAQRVLEAASVYKLDIKTQLEGLIAQCDLSGAVQLLTKTRAEMAARKTSQSGGGTRHSFSQGGETGRGEEGQESISVSAGENAGVCPLCFGELHDDNHERQEQQLQEEDAEGEDQSKKDEEEKNAGVKVAAASKSYLVSCPNHHAIHAGCLSDLFLGGNFRCPICRERMPVAAAVDVRSLAAVLQREETAPPGRGMEILLPPRRPHTIANTMDMVERRARGLRDDEVGAVDGDNGADKRLPLSREFLVRARDELLRAGLIDGAILVRGPVALRSYFLPLRQAFGIVDDIQNATVGVKTEEGPTYDQAGETVDIATRPRVGIGHGLLDPQVQQTMLTGELTRIKQVRGLVQTQLGQLRVKITDEEKEGGFMENNGGLRRMQAVMRKRRAKKDRRQRGLASNAADIVNASGGCSALAPLALGRRELSEQSKEALATLKKGGSDGSYGEAVTADVSRGHRYLELVAPLMEPAMPQKKKADPKSKTALYQAVANGDVDSAARHLRRGQISSRLHENKNAAVIGTTEKGSGAVLCEGHASFCKSGKDTKNQRKQQAILRRQLATQHAAVALGHPVCCFCKSMVESASLKPPQPADDSGIVSVSLAAESLAEQHASCVNGHIMHASCFMELVAFAQPCPACNEPLVAPPVVKRTEGENDCCAGGDRGDVVGGTEDNARLDARLDFMALCGLRFDDEDEYGQLLREEAADGGEFGGGDPLSDLRGCPGCKQGPLYNENCFDLNTHHGECQKCQLRLCSREELDRMVADRLAARRADHKKRSKESMGTEAEEERELSVIEAVPDCLACLSQGIKSKVWYNGCMGCGMAFSSLSWDSLPPYESPLEMYEGGGCGKTVTLVPRRRAFLERVRRERRAARSVAILTEQLIDDVVALLHEERALADERRRKLDVVCNQK